jgi:hypothetical protein
MNFMTVDMAKALTERLANAPKIREVMNRIYVAALQGKTDIYIPGAVLPNEKERTEITVFFLGMGYRVWENTYHQICIGW